MPYSDWGFSSSPFQTSSLPASELGEKLLVGREGVLASLTRRIKAPNKMATVEGLNGVGKTSVVNVAAYQLYRKHAETGEGPLFIPCRKIFQLDANKSAQDFIDMVLMEVAQTLIERQEDVMRHGQWLRTNEIDRWLNAPQLVSMSGGIWVINAGLQKETNTALGFEKSGFRKAVSTWLEAVFPEEDAGGIICVIDNLELLQSSDAARQVLEQLRDELFNIQGLRWVLCGALGIIYGVVSSPRLEGYLQPPIQIGEIGPEHAQELFESRISTYAKPGQIPYVPMGETEFTELYSVLKGNLRSILNYCDNYCQWVADREAPITQDKKSEQFRIWLNEQALAAYEAAKQELRPRAIEIFKLGCQKIVFSPSDHLEFGCNSIPAFRPHIKDLESVGVLVSTQDDGDKRRKTIQITPKGWLVKYYFDNAASESAVV
ncbi:MarR family transcriptional regulator [Rhizobium sp. RU36D]|uniref:MarR family transcriptional regulator n=1 Tax=Rhizobium sp. RU36D TaxID=1907415 RepID=UPI0009D7E177|nr:MarR family transcriptional regulator [Rhizobium sp. RU36D]SMD14584.1 hypothetical protein SAMN05880593_12649 [Rhizobium sp. RU36D]